jgi:hypothetical protein
MPGTLMRWQPSPAEHRAAACVDANSRLPSGRRLLACEVASCLAGTADMIMRVGRAPRAMGKRRLIQADFRTDSQQPFMSIASCGGGRERILEH